MKTPSYERIVQWAAGPVAAVVGWLSVQLTNHAGILGSAGFSAPQIEQARHYIGGALASATSVQTVGQSQIGHAIFSGLVFVAASATTFAGHQKWLSNLPKWWALQAKPAPFAPTSTGSSGTAVVTISPPKTPPVAAIAEPEPEPEPAPVVVAPANDPAPPTVPKAAPFDQEQWPAPPSPAPIGATPPPTQVPTVTTTGIPGMATV